VVDERQARLATQVGIEQGHRAPLDQARHRGVERAPRHPGRRQYREQRGRVAPASGRGEERREAAAFGEPMARVGDDDEVERRVGGMARHG
jgi:hypothetical protein